MKILIFTGGLGNQIFGYIFYKYLQKKYPLEKIYGVYNHHKMSEHYGLEVNKYFDVKLPPSPWWIQIYTAYLYCLKKLHLIDNIISMDTRTFDSKSIVNNACKMQINYIEQANSLPHFKEFILSEKNKSILNEIKSTPSVFIHVRRGDYYSPKYIARLGGTCPKEYYEKAIKYIIDKVPHARFYIFSDDIDYVKQNFSIPNSQFIDWNVNDNSYLDMYLMSNCKYAIIANSTFSFWGAMLGTKKEIVIYPTKWINSPATPPTIFPHNWITF